MTTIKLKNGSGAPLAGDLVQGEPALDLTNKRLYTEDSGGTVIEVGTNPTSVTTGTLTTTGNVGIGTSSPVGPLSLQGDAGTNGKEQGILLKYSNGTEYGALGLNNSSGWPQLMARAGAGITFHTNSDLLTTNEAMRIDSSGRLLVGTTGANYSGVDLTVGDTVDSQNGIGIQSSTTGYGHVLFGDGTGTDAYRGQISYKHGDDFLAMYTAGSEAMRIDSSGNVGIGTTLNSGGLYSGLNVRKDTTGVVDSLTLMNSQTTGASGQGVRINMSGVGEGDTDLRYAYIESATESTSNNHYIAFGTNAAFAGPTEAMRIDAAGNVGIGVSNPSSYSANANNLVIGGEANVGMHFDSNSSTGNGGIYFSDQAAVRGILAYSHTDDAMQFFTNGTTERMRILSSGGITFNGDTAAANALDDYEEGTWTPVVRGSTTSGSYTYSLGYAMYTKIGRQVTLTFYLSNITQVSAGTGYLQIIGVPFTKPSSQYVRGPVSLQNINWFNSNTYGGLEFTSAAGSDTLYVRLNGDNYGGSDLQVNELVSGSSDIGGTITYFAS